MMEKCPVCSSTKTQQLPFTPRYGTYILMKCRSCGLKFILSKNYEILEDDTYWDEVNRKIYAMPAVLEEFKKKQSKYLGRILKSSPPNKRLLDVGCGNGIFLENAKSFGLNATGIEPSKIAIELCQKQFGCKPIHGYLEIDSSLPKNFGVLSAWDVIEHVFDPSEFLKILYVHLEKDGILILETPDESSLIRWLINIVDSVRRLLGVGGSSNIYYPSHRYYFTHDSMKKLLKKVGFRNVKIYKEKSIFSKSLMKYKLYRKKTSGELIKYKIIFFILRLPIFWNKQVVMCRKS